MADPVFGVLPEGFRRMTQADLIARFESDQLAEMSASLDLSPEQPLGQQNGIVGRALGIVWEILEILYHANDPEEAEDRLLEMVCKLTGTFRRGDTFTTVKLTLNIDDGTELVSGTHFAAIEDEPDVRFTPAEDFTAVGSGDHTIDFRAEQGGPIVATAGTINVIATPVVGWNTVVNPNDADPGDRTEADPALRVRREEELAVVGSATVRAITADVSHAFQKQLENLVVFENETDNVDARGLPPHSIEVLFYDGLTPTIDNDAMAQTILESKGGGIQAFGTSSGSAIALVNGFETPVDVGFTRAAQVAIYIEIDLETTSDYVGDAALLEYIASEANKRFGPGKTVIASVVQSLPLQLEGVHDIRAVRIGISPSPSGGGNVAMDVRQIARFDTTRIVLNRTSV